jgi:membrane protein DedA with SNARE-associated domain
MPFWRFTTFTVLGCIPWVLGLTLIGRSAGDNWDDWKDKLHYVDYLVAAVIVIAAAWLLVRYLRRRRATPAPGEGS